jgi:DNA-binding beta-propeller fold protein YncE
MMVRFLFSALFLVQSGLFGAQLAADASAVRIAGPRLGFLFDPASGRILPVDGIAGAAVFGEPLPETFVDAAISPSRDYAIVRRAGEPSLELLVLEPDRRGFRELPAAVTDADVIVFSPQGTAIGLYNRGTRRILVLTEVLSEVRLVRDLTPASISGSIEVVAVSDDGGQVAIGTSTGEVWQFGPGDTARRLPNLGEVGAIRFLGPQNDIALADRLLNTVYLVRGDGETVILAGQREGVLKPAALEASADNGRVFIANQEGGVVSVDLATGEILRFPCEGRIAGLHRFEGNAVFHFGGDPATPIPILDADSIEAGVVFLPAKASSAEATSR